MGGAGKAVHTGAIIRRKEYLLSGLDLRAARGMELGPFYQPLVLKSEGDITYVDRMSAEELVERQRVSMPNFDASLVPAVDVVTGDRPLSEALAGRTFDYIIASHVIEHVPNLVGWLEQFRGLLAPGGTLRLAVPDKRYSFDLRRRLTELSDVVGAHLRDLPQPSPQIVFEAFDKSKKVDFKQAWDGALPNRLEPYFSRTIALDMARRAADGQYVDVHCWVFTPKSFCGLMADLSAIGLVNFACADLYPTEKYSFEFIAVLAPSDDRAGNAASWKAASAFHQLA
jgi:SAM-dependent methyltransferase